ncbi:acetyltransferase (GNAT) family protein [Pasteurella langaaensis DSM 22999]|uniref:Acetyltransferase (GNAT) family protein n=1 Tax=Alitibacter langaaensis DSM 22999 TaxID=1122935 RepID=A0A2U0TGX6_9PAST|nr:GNAT family N-acetyltransferase [Pasteurella langaaensis]PVX42862.1 acetyltransferase (GNAT) family protein [Pasteurella langaaensis DSM 22999]
MISYKTNVPISASQFIELLKKTTLGERRPLDNMACVEGMLDHSNLVITAWDNERLVGIARSVTDFNYCCYLSDLAVDETYQQRGIGQQLIAETEKSLAKTCKIILLSAPQAVNYYPHIGFKQHPSAWTKLRNE